MKKYVIAFSSLIIFIFSGALFAADKIGFVNINEVLHETDAGKKADDELKKIYDKNKLLIQGTESDLQKMKGEVLNARESKLFTEEAIKEKEATYEKKLNEYQVMLREANRQVQTKEQENIKSMYSEIEKILNSLGEKEKYTAIFDASSGVIPYYNKSSNLTKRIIEEFNKSYKPKTK